jgi:hypothetical protein
MSTASPSDRAASLGDGAAAQVDGSASPPAAEAETIARPSTWIRGWRRLRPLASALLLAGCSLAQARQAAGCMALETTVALPDSLDRVSAITESRRWPGLFWGIVGEGESANLYGFDDTGVLRAQVRVRNAKNKDWEALATGPCPTGWCLYVGDVGDQHDARDSVTIWRVPEPALGDTVTRPAQALLAAYPTGPRDASGMFVLPSGDVYLVTRGRKSPEEVWRLRPPFRRHAVMRLDFVRRLAPQPALRENRVTGAAASPDGRWVGLRTYDGLYLWPTTAFLDGTDVPWTASLAPLEERDGVGLAMGPRGEVLITSQGRKKLPAIGAHLVCMLPSGHAAA